MVTIVKKKYSAKCLSNLTTISLSDFFFAPKTQRHSNYFDAEFLPLAI